MSKLDQVLADFKEGYAADDRRTELEAAEARASDVGKIVHVPFAQRGSAPDAFLLESGARVELLAETWFPVRARHVLVPRHFAHQVTLRFVRAQRIEYARAGGGNGELAGERFSMGTCEKCRAEMPPIELPFPAVLHAGTHIWIEVCNRSAGPIDCCGIELEAERADHLVDAQLERQACLDANFALREKALAARWSPLLDTESGRVLSYCRSCGLEGFADEPLQSSDPEQAALRALLNSRKLLAALSPTSRARVLDLAGDSSHGGAR